MKNSLINVTLLAGGGGGAKIAEGLDSISNINLSIIGNIADDDIFHGLSVSPDIDTLIYTLSGIVNKSQGWGVKKDTYQVLSILKKLGNPIWMSLGDIDFGLHIYRSERLKRGDRPFDVARDIARSLKVKPHIILPTDDSIKTRVRIRDGWLSFQEYFVEKKCVPEVLELDYKGIKKAKPNVEAFDAIDQSDIVLIAPSNPLLSIEPILNIPGFRERLNSSKAIKIAISPLISGKAIKGPADKIMLSLGMCSDSYGIANFYKNFIDIMVIDTKDRSLYESIKSLGLRVETLNTLMKTKKDKINLSKAVINFGKSFLL